MTAPSNGHANGVKVRAIPLMAMIPPNVGGPQFSCVAQWHTPAGILCQPQPVPLQPITQAMLLQLFVNLVNSGVVGQILKDQAGADVVVDLPPLNLTLRPAPLAAPTPAEPNAESAKPPSRIILPE